MDENSEPVAVENGQSSQQLNPTTETTGQGPASQHTTK